MKRLWTGVPGASWRWTRALACGVGAVLLVAAALPAGDDGNVFSLSVVPTSGRAHVVIGVHGAITVRDFALQHPDRIVVDITGATLGVKRGGYDRIARGGVLDVRYAQNQPNVVRVVLTLAGPRRYEVIHEPGAVRVAVEGGADFTAWRVGKPGLEAPSLAKARFSSDTVPKSVSAQVTSISAPPLDVNAPATQQQRPQQPRITIAWEKADIRDVLAAFAAFSGRTIIPARGVEATVTAEIIDQPWDVAMRAILNANGFDAAEDENGIIVVSTIEALAARPRYELLTTRTVRFNYTGATAVADAIRQRLTRDCGAAQAQPTLVGTGPAGQGQAVAAPLQCPVRGAVTADELSNSVSITDVSSSVDDLVAYALTLDLRQPQVNIKAKIILIDRSQLEGFGLKYDLGSPVQHFNDVVARTDSTGARESGNPISLGGNAISAVANAATGVPNATLRIIYSAAIGAFDITTFMDAMQELSLLDVQAEPSVTTLNYRTATLSAGTQVPVRTIEPGTGGNVGGAFPQVTVQLKQVGIVLRVTPSITNNRQVKMVIHAENSDVAFQGGDVVVFPTQSIDNELLVADGETAVMGGLTQTSVRVSRQGIPILMQLPLLGRLFGVTNRSETKRDLLILITPHIVDEGDMTMTPRRSP